MGNYLGRAASYAMHKKYPSGSQTAAQLAAERANLKAARAARGQMRHTKSVPYHGLRKTTIKMRETGAAARAFNMREMTTMKAHAMGIRFMRYQKRAGFKKPSISGIPKKFAKEVGPGRAYGRTQWGRTRHHGFRKRLYKRQHRLKQVSRWKFRGKRFTPR
jgi:hypothetical protein